MSWVLHVYTHWNYISNFLVLRWCFHPYWNYKLGMYRCSFFYYNKMKCLNYFPVSIRLKPIKPRSEFWNNDPNVCVIVSNILIFVKISNKYISKGSGDVGLKEVRNGGEDFQHCLILPPKRSNDYNLIDYL